MGKALKKGAIMNKRSKKHHYIPQFFLNNFANKVNKSYLFYVYDKNNNKCFPNSVNNIGYIKDFHTVEIDGYEPDVIERLHYKTFERRYAPTYRQLMNKIHTAFKDMKVCNCLSNNRIDEILNEGCLSENDKKFLSVFLAYLIIRGKRWRLQGDKLYRDIGLIMEDYRGVYEKLDYKELSKIAQIQSTFDGVTSINLATQFYKHIWNLGFNMTDNTICTNDNVCVLTFAYSDFPIMRLGFSSYGNIIIFPLSPHVCIRMFDPKYIRDKEIILLDKTPFILSEEEVECINSLMIEDATDQIYSIDNKWNN